MVRPNKLGNSKATDVFTVEWDEFTGVYKLVKTNIGGRWIVKFSSDIGELAQFISDKDIFIENYKEYKELIF